MATVSAESGSIDHRLVYTRIRGRRFGSAHHLSPPVDVIDEPAFVCEIRREQLFDFLRRERRRDRGVARRRIRRRGDQKELRDAENTRDEHQRSHEHFDEG
jgi:hypothetical protein